MGFLLTITAIQPLSVYEGVGGHLDVNTQEAQPAISRAPTPLPLGISSLKIENLQDDE